MPIQTSSGYLHTRFTWLRIRRRCVLCFIVAQHKQLSYFKHCSSCTRYLCSCAVDCFRAFLHNYEYVSQLLLSTYEVSWHQRPDLNWTFKKYTMEYLQSTRMIRIHIILCPTVYSFLRSAQTSDVHTHFKLITVDKVIEENVHFTGVLCLLSEIISYWPAVAAQFIFS